MLHGFYNAKSVFIAVTASLRWLNNVNGVYFIQVSLLLICKQGLVNFFRYRPLLPLSGGLCKFFANAKLLIQRQPLLVQYKHQVNPLFSMNNYTPLVISRNDKYKQLTLLSQCKLAFTAINELFGL